MSEVTSPILLDSTGQEIRDALLGVKQAIENHSGGGGAELPELTNPAAEAQVLNGYEFIDGLGEKKTGTIPTVGAASINMYRDGAEVFAQATQLQGYVSGQETQTNSLKLPIYAGEVEDV